MAHIRIRHPSLRALPMAEDRQTRQSSEIISEKQTSWKDSSTTEETHLKVVTQQCQLVKNSH